MTVNGNPALVKIAPKFNQAAYFDGDGDYLEVPDNDDWYFGSGNFTIDFWVKTNSISSDIGFCGQYQPPNNNMIRLSFSPTVGLSFYDQTGSIYVTQGDTEGWEANQWTHVALVRNGSNWLFFINGVNKQTRSNGNSVTNKAANLDIGMAERDGGAYDYLNGYLDDFRITKGEALWTSDFTPPTSAATTNANTKLLLDFDGDFDDLSTSDHTATANGDVKTVDMNNQFDEAMSFDGTGDYLSIPDSEDWNFGSGDFTVDTWINRSSSGDEYSIFDTTAGYTGIELTVNTNNKLELSVTDGGTWFINQVESSMTV